MPFKDLSEGSTHSENDGCGEKEHNHECHAGVTCKEHNKKHCDKCSYESNEGLCISGCGFCGCHNQPKKPRVSDIVSEFAERIVIDYANLSGRDSEHRAEFRERVLKHLVKVEDSAYERGKEEFFTSKRIVELAEKSEKQGYLKGLKDAVECLPEVVDFKGNKKHAGKSFCPQCEDGGYNQALEESKVAIQSILSGDLEEIPQMKGTLEALGKLPPIKT